MPLQASVDTRSKRHETGRDTGASPLFGLANHPPRPANMHRRSLAAICLDLVPLHELLSVICCLIGRDGVVEELGNRKGQIPTIQRAKTFVH